MRRYFFRRTNRRGRCVASATEQLFGEVVRKKRKQIGRFLNAKGYKIARVDTLCAEH